MGESFNDKDNIKRVDLEDSYDDSNEEGETPTVINIDIDNDNEQGENDKYQLPPSSPPPALYSDAPLVSEFDFTTNIEYNFECPSHLPRKLI